MITSGVLATHAVSANGPAGMVRLLDEKYPGFVWAVNRGWAQNNRKDLVGFLRAWLAGVRWVKENRDEAIKVLLAETGLPQPAAARFVGEAPADGALNPANLQAVLEIRNEFGTPPRLGPALERYYDTSYYREATGR